ncbi:MAG: DCC1-like thiol-disulfide oxidoreductase family protein [Cystobacter sp.]
MSTSKHLLFFDGVCVLCNHTIHFIHARDRQNVFLFTELQGALARELLARHGRDAGALDGVYLLTDRGSERERLLPKYAAVRFILGQLGGGWRLLSALMGVLPRPVGDLFYDLVARNRYKLLGKYEQCAIPSPELRRKYVTDGE